MGCWSANFGVENVFPRSKLVLISMASYGASMIYAGPSPNPIEGYKADQMSYTSVDGVRRKRGAMNRRKSSQSAANSAATPM
jgi:hypothetical protein